MEMDFTIVTTGICLLLQISFHFVTGEECTYRPPCTCETKNFVLNLEPLMAKRGSPLQVTDFNESYTYYIDPCNKALTITECVNVDKNIVACQMSPDKLAYGLGITGNYAASGDPDLGTVKFTNSFVGKDNINRIMEMAVKCADKDGDLTFVGHTLPPTEITYSFTLSTRYACEASPSSSGGLSAGSVLVILFFVFLLVYIVGGVLFLKIVRKAEGREAIPNYEFWKELPLLVKDGVLFTCRGCKAESTYEKI